MLSASLNKTFPSFNKSTIPIYWIQSLPVGNSDKHSFSVSIFSFIRLNTPCWQTTSSVVSSARKASQNFRASLMSSEVSGTSSSSPEGARCSSVVRAFAHGAMGCRIDPSWGGPIELFLVPASAPRLV